MESQFRRTKFYYFFRGELSFGVQFYQAWVGAVRKEGIPMRLITVLPIRKYFKEYKLVQSYKKRNVLIFPEVPGQLVSKLYFSLQCIVNKKVVIHLKKRDPSFFDMLKRLFSDRLKYIVEGEGDPQSELEYLLEHPYKQDFYSNDLRNLKSSITQQYTILCNSDLYTVGYKAMKDMLVCRYPDLPVEDQIALMPMSFSKDKMVFDSKQREHHRRKLDLGNKLVFVYIGNAYYSWQNVCRTIQIFKLIQKAFNPDSYLVLLVRKSDHQIVREFIKQEGLMKNEFLLKAVPHDEVPGYLFAADVGICLRHDHIMNRTTPAGKILDYLACGLPVLTTKVMGETYEFIGKESFGVILDDMDNDDEILHKVDFFSRVDNEKRTEISKWANENISSESMIQDYISELLKLAS